MSKSGKPLGRYFPEVVDTVLAMEADRFVLDGELVIPVDGILSFDALQLRLHPAESRVNRLALETPAQLMLFDLLFSKETSYLDAPLELRRRSLEIIYAAEQHDDLLLSPCTTGPEARPGLARPGRSGARRSRRQAARRPLRIRASGRCSRSRRCAPPTASSAASATAPTASRSPRSCSASTTRTGLLHHVGFTSAIPAGEKAALTERLEALIEAPGLHRRLAGRAEPLVDRAHRRMAAAEARAGRRGALRPCHRPPLPPRHQVPALAAGQGAGAMPDGPAPARRGRGDARRPAEGGVMKPERIVEGVRLSNPDKVLYPEQGITKGQLADYYVAVADRILPHLAFRPVTMVRCPMGQETKCFYQRHAGSGVLRAAPRGDDPRLRRALSLHLRRRRAGRDGADGGAGDASLGRQGGGARPRRPDRLRSRPGRGPRLRGGDRGGEGGARPAEGARPRSASSRRPAARASTSSFRSRRRRRGRK